MKACACCPQVPVVSRELTLQLYARLRQGVGTIPRVKVAAFDWLTSRTGGMRIYEGIAGRPYAIYEQDRIAEEVHLVAGLGCPFVGVVTGCLVGTLGPSFNRQAEAGKQEYGFLPTLLARLIDNDEYVRLVKSKQIADAKVSFLTRPDHFPEPDALATKLVR